MAYYKVSRITLLVGLLSLMLGCQKAKQEAIMPLFTALPATVTGIEFRNDLVYTEVFNVYTYRNFYNGGGVGIGDINNDGLADLYFCGNQADNKLYLNKGNFQFEDITAQAGVACPNVWSTGVSFADVNGDGWLDIYVCKSGDVKGDNRYNELFINNGDLTFTEQAIDYGIADKGLSTHAAFFDFDRDGDLDCYLLNNSFRPVGGYDLRPGQREIRDSLGGNKLYRLDGDRYVDVSAAAGIYGSTIGFGLGVTIGDVNRDGWQDIFVSNDFFEKDYLYINNQDGTFKEDLESYMREISMGSMGADMADINNDGYPEIYVTDMLPEDDARMKTKTNFENWDKHQLNVRNGYFHQFTRNVLQLNNQDETFSEISRYANVHATDWSWGALMSDFDNDGQKDIFVANGIFKDLTDQDYVNFMGDPNTVREILRKENAVLKRLIDSIPSEPLPNYLFVNQGDLTFQNKAKEWGLGTPSHSNGSAYGDLDNDGDLDLVVNNVNMAPFIYQNNSETLLPQNHYLKIELKGAGKNPFGMGAQVTLRKGNQTFYQEQAPMRGFESSVAYQMIFGLGAIETVDSVIVNWNNGQQSILTQVPTNQKILIDQTKTTLVKKGDLVQPVSPTLFQTVNPAKFQLQHQHQENNFIDFDRDQLLYHMLSSEGPCLGVADVNGDGLDDFYIGGAKDQAGSLYFQKADGSFNAKANQTLLAEDQISEDTDCLFFDSDNDGDLDLYVTSGGNEFSSSSSALRDRLYLNDGKGLFSKSPQNLPAGKYESSSCVKSADIDGDGDQDLFIGLRLQPFLYGVPVNGYLLLNEGGKFRPVNRKQAPELNKLGMITDATWLDYDQDGDPDLFVVGDWMPLTLFQNDQGRLTKVSEAAGLAQSNGFWNCLKVGDFNQDGFPDLVVGNQGLNTRIKASVAHPVTMHINDFDQNGKAEQLISVPSKTGTYPLALRHDLIKQIPSLKKKYLYYRNYKEQSIEDIFTAEQLAGAIKQEAFRNESMVLLNQKDGTFALQALPFRAQLSPIFGLLVDDFDEDGMEDILLGGNFYRSKPELGIYAAGYGLYLKGDGKGAFETVEAKKSGIKIRGEIRDLESIEINGAPFILVGKNNDRLQILKKNK